MPLSFSATVSLPLFVSVFEFLQEQMLWRRPNHSSCKALPIPAPAKAPRRGETEQTQGTMTMHGKGIKDQGRSPGRRQGDSHLRGTASSVAGRRSKAPGLVYVFPQLRGFRSPFPQINLLCFYIGLSKFLHCSSLSPYSVLTRK